MALLERANTHRNPRWSQLSSICHQCTCARPQGLAYKLDLLRGTILGVFDGYLCDPCQKYVYQSAHALKIVGVKWRYPRGVRWTSVRGVFFNKKDNINDDVLRDKRFNCTIGLNNDIDQKTISSNFQKWHLNNNVTSYCNTRSCWSSFLYSTQENSSRRMNGTIFFEHSCYVIKENARRE
jgi:hypothetical protein